MSDYYPFLLLFILPLLLCCSPVIIGAVLKRKGRDKAGKICLFTGFLFLSAFGCFLLLTETSALSAFEQRVDTAFPLVCFGLIAAGLTVFFFTRLKKPVRTAVVVFALVFTFGGLAGMEIYQHGYYDKHPPQPLVDNIFDYLPYIENSKTAVLDEESTLKLTDDLPVMDGATALYPVYAAFAKAVYPESSINTTAIFGKNGVGDGSPLLTCFTTTGAYERILTEEADIIFVAAPSEKQKQAAQEAGIELVYTPIGKEAFVFFVNTKNPADDLSVEEVQNIYSGKITRWKQLGVKMPGKIIAFQRSEGSGSQSALKRLMGDIPLAEAPINREIIDMGGMFNTVSDYRNFKNAIGFSFRFYTTEMINSSGVKLLKINGVEPTAENIANGTYPISDPFYAVTRAGADENTKKLLAWITGEQGQELVAKTGYVPIL